MTDISAAKLLVIFATHNGAGVLPDVLAGYAAAAKPDMAWAMIAVDNASTDNTTEILRSYQTRLPLVVLSETRPGKNRALNRALDHAGLSAALYIFTDDDAIPAPDFLRSWEETLQMQTGRELFGGTVRPYFRQQPPAWLQRFTGHFPELYAMNEREAGEIAAQDIFGPNMAASGSLLARGHRFNESIGPNSGESDYPMGSETEFCVRVEPDLRAPPWFASGPSVRHIVRPNQTTRDFVGRRAFRHGRGAALRQVLAGKAPRLSVKSRVKLALRWLAIPFGDGWWQYNWVRGYRNGLAAYCQKT